MRERERERESYQITTDTIIIPELWGKKNGKFR